MISQLFKGDRESEKFSVQDMEMELDCVDGRAQTKAMRATDNWFWNGFGTQNESTHEMYTHCFHRYTEFLLAGWLVGWFTVWSVLCLIQTENVVAFSHTHIPYETVERVLVAVDKQQ